MNTRGLAPPALPAGGAEDAALNVSWLSFPQSGLQGSRCARGRVDWVPSSDRSCHVVSARKIAHFPVPWMTSGLPAAMRWDKSQENDSGFLELRIPTL